MDEELDFNVLVMNLNASLVQQACIRLMSAACALVGEYMVC